MGIRCRGFKDQSKSSKKATLALIINKGYGCNCSNVVGRAKKKKSEVGSLNKMYPYSIKRLAKKSEVGTLNKMYPYSIKRLAYFKPFASQPTTNPITKLILIPVIGFIILSCNQKPKSTDTSQNNKPANIESTEIDFVKSSPDKTKIVLENEFVRVIEYSLKPGEKDSTHTHPPKTSYVISGGTLRVYPENEKPFDSEEVAGTVEWAGKRGRHYVENIGQTTVTILLTEIKTAEQR
jgi:beta-alanine degradation protein BauB